MFAVGSFLIVFISFVLTYAFKLFQAPKKIFV